MFGNIRDFIRIQRVLNKIYVGENLIKNLSGLFGVECRKDWVGRLYMVVNPILQNIESDGNTLIYDQDDTQMVEAWVMKNLELSRNFVLSNQLFDMLTYTIERLDDDDNYLVVFKNIAFDDFIKTCKRILVILAILGVVGIALAVIF